MALHGLHTELEQYAPTAFAAPPGSRFPDPETAPQVLGNPFLNRLAIRSLAVTRKPSISSAPPFLFEVERGWFEFVPFTYLGQPLPIILPLNPGDRLYAICRIDWTTAQTTFRELVSTFPDVVVTRDFRYKTGVYKVVSATLTKVASGADAPEQITYSHQATDGSLPATAAETHAFLLGQALPNGTWLANLGPRGNLFLPAGLFDIAPILQP